MYLSLQKPDEGGLDLLELESQMVVSHYVGVVNWTQISCESNKCSRSHESLSVTLVPGGSHTLDFCWHRTHGEHIQFKKFSGHTQEGQPLSILPLLTTNFVMRSEVHSNALSPDVTYPFLLIWDPQEPPEQQTIPLCGSLLCTVYSGITSRVSLGHHFPSPAPHRSVAVQVMLLQTSKRFLAHRLVLSLQF